MICPLLRILDNSTYGGEHYGVNLSSICLEAGNEGTRGDFKGDSG